MDIKILEEIGLNKSEIKVYLALLKLGASTTGPIISESKTANSKIYEVLTKLTQKGLVSYFMKENVKYFKAASPKMIAEYLKEKRNRIEEQEKKISEILPSLIRIEKAHEEEKQAVIFSGPRGIKTAFRNIVDELNPGEEVRIMGVYSFSSKFKRLALFFQKIRSHKDIKAKFLMNSGAVELTKEFRKYPPVEIKYLPKEMLTPAIFLIYNDKVIINLADEMTFFVIKSKSTAITFNSYFKTLWKSASKK